ncbi:MAG TPA: type II toxin-antitoxin system prevent-host-death family antitoxin [Candidatus Binatia bacterium]|jgi:prevent-host-death family protein
MDRFLTASEARQQFLKLLSEVEDGERVIITRRGKPSAVVIDFEQHQLLADLARLWQNPQTLSQVRTAHEEARAGRVFSLKGIPTVERLVKLARSKRVVKKRRG